MAPLSVAVFNGLTISSASQLEKSLTLLFCYVNVTWREVADKLIIIKVNGKVNVDLYSASS